MEEAKDFSKAPGSYHWALVIFIYLFIYLFMHFFIYFFLYLFFNVNKFLLTIVNNNFYNLSLLKLFWHTGAVSQRCSPGERCFVGVMWILRGHPCMGVISVKLQSGLVGIALLHVCSPVGSLRIWTVPLLENTSGVLLLNIDNFIYNF